jgi:hypothetical protein
LKPLVIKRPKTRQKNRAKQTREENQNGGKNPAFFVMSPDGFFGFFPPVILNSPCYEAPKNATKKSMKK